MRIISQCDNYRQPVVGVGTIIPYIPRLLAVYGTLKQGYHNHHLLQQFKFVGHAVTMDDQFYMTPEKGSFPIVYTLPQDGYSRVSVELYEITDEAALKQVDRLENHPDWYTRKPFSFVDDKDKMVTAEMYVMRWDFKRHLPETLPDIAEWKASG